MVWYPLLGWGVFWIGLIVAIILLSIHKKIYPVFYIISISLYIFTAGFVIDVFNLEELGILVVLVLSAILFMGLGYYLSKVFHLENKK
jgi:hypothetical protein|tara:strand:- start:33 stop:296 length:264 start_codon:yes stop_codon:yes gene_type:complete